MAGISFFGPAAEAPVLHETDVMSMPTMDPPAPEQFVTWALSGGHNSRVQFRDGGETGMSLVWTRFEAGYPLPRHSHSADCLYYVVKGEARLGNKVVPAGEGFFVPADAPYAYTAGPEGIEILEFRSTSHFDMKITESEKRWTKIAEEVEENKPTWPARAGSTS